MKESAYNMYWEQWIRKYIWILKKIACKYNGFYEKMRLQCKDCYLIENCGECFLQFPMKDGVPVCRVKMDEISYRSYLSKLFGVLEENPTFFEQINKMIFA